MSREVDTSKKKITKAEAHYLFQRPWLTSDSVRRQVVKMVMGSPEEPEPTPEPAEDNEE